jgi:O-antigen/teichoic acid export membrane protein
VVANDAGKRLRNVSFQAIAGLAALATVYSAVILAFGGDVLALVYKKPEITAAAGWLWFFSTVAVLDAVSAAMGIVLVAIGVTKFTFWARLASTALLIAVALYLSRAIGVEAILWASVAGSAASSFIHGFALFKSIQRESFRRTQGIVVGPAVGGA